MEKDQVFLQTVVEKIAAQEKELKEMQQTLNDTSSCIEQMQALEKEIKELKSIIKGITFPTAEMRKLSQDLDTSASLLRQPVQTKVEHHHHFGKILFVTSGLFIVVCLLSAGWLTTYRNLSQYKTNDTKYRYLKLYPNPSLRKLLHTTDSMHRAIPHLRDSVLWQEKMNQERFEMQQQIHEKENEVKKLKRRLPSDNKY